MERPSLTRLRTEIRQTKPFASAAVAAAVALVRTTDEVRRMVNGVVSPHSISAEQYNVLRILRGAGADGLPTLEIAARLLERNPGITRLLDKLEARQFVRRVRRQQDRRQVLCYITPQGERLLAQLHEPLQTAQRKQFGGLTDAELLQLIDVLDRIRNSRE